MHPKIKNIGKSILRATNSDGSYPQEYVDILEPTMDALRLEISKAEKFFQESQNLPWIHRSNTAKEYLDLIKQYTDGVAMRQESYKGLELYLPFHMGLYLLVRFSKPEIVLETGVERGGSTFALLKGLYENRKGTLYSYDISNSTRFLFENQEWLKGKEAKEQRKDVKRIYVPIGTLVPNWLKQNWNLIIGDSIKKVPQTLKEVGVIDFFVAGYGHTYDIQKADIENIWDSLINGGILVIDRSDWEDDKFFNELKEKHGLKEYVICKESKLSLKFNYVIIIKR